MLTNLEGGNNMKKICKKCCMMCMAFVLTLVNAFPVTPVFASDTITIDCGSVLRGVTHCASGSLYGITETKPADINGLVAPLQPYVMRNPARGGAGNQHPFGDAIKVAAKLAAVPSARVSIDLADMLPGWPYKWPGMESWLTQVKSFIADKKASGSNNFYGYEPWNEPDGTWNNANGTFEDMWLQTYKVIRENDPNAKIIGPCDSYYTRAKMSKFLSFCKTNNCIPDIMSWHELGGVQNVSNNMKDYRSLEASLGISALPISINEYCDAKHELEGQPGSSACFIGKFERYKVESACISWWFVPNPGRLGSLLATDTEKGAGWYLFKWYGDMTGNMVSVTPPNDASTKVDGAASVDSSAKYISFIMGGTNDGTITTTFKNIPSFIGSTASIKIEKVDWISKDTVSKGPTVVASKNYAVSNGQLTLTMTGCNSSSGYRIYITPGTGTPDAVSDISASGTTDNTTGSTPVATPIPIPVITPAIKKDSNYIYYEAENINNTLSGAAKIASVSNCSGGSAVGYVGNGDQNALQFNKIKVTKKGTYQIKLDYCSGEQRNVTITVNNGKPIELTGLQSGGWSDPSEVTFKATLKKGSNVIKLTNATAYAPDIDLIAVSKKTVKK